MRIMALDLGSRTIGVAVSDPLSMLASGIYTIRRSSAEQDFTHLQALISEYEITKIVVGYPKNMNGSIGPGAKNCEIFAQKLRKRFNTLNVLLWDERLSTVSAEKAMRAGSLRRDKRKKIIDMMAAVVILQNFLDSPQNN